MRNRKLFHIPAWLLILAGVAVGAKWMLLGSPKTWFWYGAEFVAFWALMLGGIGCLSMAYTNDELER